MIKYIKIQNNLNIDYKAGSLLLFLYINIKNLVSKSLLKYWSTI